MCVSPSNRRGKKAGRGPIRPWHGGRSRGMLVACGGSSLHHAAAPVQPGAVAAAAGGAPLAVHARAADVRGARPADRSRGRADARGGARQLLVVPRRAGRHSLRHAVPARRRPLRGGREPRRSGPPALLRGAAGRQGRQRHRCARRPADQRVLGALPGTAGIGAMLDVPVYVRGRLVGVVATSTSAGRARGPTTSSSSRCRSASWSRWRSRRAIARRPRRHCARARPGSGTWRCTTR